MGVVNTRHSLLLGFLTATTHHAIVITIMIASDRVGEV